MQLIPDTERYSTTAEAAANNFESLGAEVQRPNKAVFGFTPSGGACYDPVTDTVYIGAEISAKDKRTELATYEHENVHYEQFRRILEEPPEEIHSSVENLEKQALSTALDHFEDPEFVDALTAEQHLNYHNFRTMLGLATEHPAFMDEIHDLKANAEERIALVDEDNPGIENSPEIISYRSAAETAEEIAEEYWNQIQDDVSVEEFSQLTDRYDHDVERDDLLEAQAHFWSLFSVGILEEAYEPGEPLNPKIRQFIENLDYYNHQEHYQNGDNVENETENMVKEFRERKHEEAKSDPDIAVEMLNEGLEIWERKGKTKALAD